MCIIILNSKQKLTKDVINTSWINNNDGAGLLYLDSNNKFQVYKTMNNKKEYYKRYSAARQESKHPIVLHFRIATHGKVNTKNIHPFKVNNNLYFAHNGIIDIETNNKVSDTIAFNEKILKNLHPNFLNNKAIQELLSVYIGSSKLVFLHKNGTPTIINEDKGHWDNFGNWYSNYSYTEYTYPKTTKKGYTECNYSQFDYCDICGKFLQTSEEYSQGLCSQCIHDFQ